MTAESVQLYFYDVYTVCIRLWFVRKIRAGRWPKRDSNSRPPLCSFDIHFHFDCTSDLRSFCGDEFARESHIPRRRLIKTWQQVGHQRRLLVVNKIAAPLLAVFLCNTLGAQTPQPQVHPTRLASTRDLAKFVGTYPCSNGLLQDRVLLSSLRKVLDSDYQAYREHMGLSGCGAIEKRDGFLLMDVSQLHVGGYTSLIFIRLHDGALFLFWLKSTVAEKHWSFYGQRPIPTTVCQIVESELNKEWGHVAQFSFDGENLEIRLNDSR